MSLVRSAKVGKKYALYLPKAIVRILNLKEGADVVLEVSGKTVLIRSLEDPLQLALSGEKFATVKPERVEAISLEEQNRGTKGTT